MKTKLMAAVAAIAVMTANGVARAETADSTQINSLKAQSAALKKENQALEQRLNKLEQQQTAAAQQAAAKPAPSSFMAADLPFLKGGPAQCAPLTLDGPLTFCGITVFGTVDAGLGWASYGLPNNGPFYLGNQLVNKYAQHSYFGASPNNLSQSAIGIKGTTELLPGLSGVFMASTGFNPISGQLANTPQSIINNNGLNRSAYSINGDGSRGGQAFNDQLYAGLSSPVYGQLTVGRHRSMTTDLVVAYDPTGGSYGFSPIGYSGTPVAGLGNTENARWDDSIKYRVEYGPAHFGAIYKFADGNGGCNYLGTGVAPAGTVQQCFGSKNDAGQLGGGFTYNGFDFDGVAGYVHQTTILTAPLSAAQAFAGSSTFTPNWVTPTFGKAVTSVGVNSDTVQANIADTAGFALAGKYTWNQWKFYAGWAHVVYHNPENNVGIGGQNDQGGYQFSSVNNAAYPHARLLDTVWVGSRYAYNEKTEIVGGFYVEHQNSYGWAAGSPQALAQTGSASSNLATCSLPAYINYNPYAKGTFSVNKPSTWGNQTQPRSGTCSGNLYGASTYIDYHFNKRFDIYGGINYTSVTGGLAAGYFSASNWAPTVGARFTF